MSDTPSVPRHSASNLTRRKLLARNVVWSLAGVGLPLLAALLAIPMLTNSLGTGRFSLMSLSWVFIGYFTIFDFGLALALTKLVSTRIAEARQETLPGLIGTALWFASGVSLVCAVGLWTMTPWLVGSAMKIPLELQAEAAGVFRLLAASIPMVIIGTVLRGVLESLQRFDAINIVRIFNGVYMLAGPLLLLPFTHDMRWLVGALVAGKVLASVAFLILCLRELPQLRHQMRWHADEIRGLFVFGGWITIGNVAGPLLNYLDQFMIGALIALPMVAYYSVPYQMVERLRPIIYAVVGVLFPALSIQLLSDRERARWLFLAGFRAVVLSIAPATLVIAALAGPLLQWWLGGDYGRIAGPIAQILAIGVLINSFNSVLLGLVQASGHPDWVPKLSLAEAPFYVLALYLAISKGGLLGAALVGTLRIVIEFVFLMWAAMKVLPEAAPALRRGIPGLIVLGAAFLPFLLPLPLVPRIALLGTFLLIWAASCWLLMISGAERAALLQMLRTRRSVQLPS